MDFKVKREYKSENLYEKAFECSQPLDIDSIITILKNYERENTKMYSCKCETFTESGNTVGREYSSIEELQGLYKLPNPSIQVTAIYIDKKTNQYKFDISTANNSNVIVYSISNRIAKSVSKRMELEAMLEEEKKVM